MDNNQAAKPLCQCGREIGPRAHCPECGAMKCYLSLKKKDIVTRPDGTRVELRVWRCTQCGRRFNDDDWQLRCEAKRPQLGRPKGRNGGAKAQAPTAYDPAEMLERPDIKAVIERFNAELLERKRKTPQELFHEAKQGESQ